MCRLPQVLVMVAAGEAARLVGLGLVMGFVHVLSGPDHLSALATLSVGSTWRAFFLGVRWGLGHSTGLVLMALVFGAFDGELDLGRLAVFCDWVVGLVSAGGARSERGAFDTQAGGCALVDRRRAARLLHSLMRAFVDSGLVGGSVHDRARGVRGGQGTPDTAPA